MKSPVYLTEASVTPRSAATLSKITYAPATQSLATTHSFFSIPYLQTQQPGGRHPAISFYNYNLQRSQIYTVRGLGSVRGCESQVRLHFLPIYTFGKRQLYHQSTRAQIIWHVGSGIACLLPFIFSLNHSYIFFPSAPGFFHSLTE